MTHRATAQAEAVCNPLSCGVRRTSRSRSSFPAAVARGRPGSQSPGAQLALRPGMRSKLKYVNPLEEVSSGA
jgi:hypothetical protein